MRYEFIIQHGGVLLNLHDVDGHGGNLSDDDPTKCIRNVQFRVCQLEFESVARRRLKDSNLGPMISLLLYLIVTLNQVIAHTADALSTVELRVRCIHFQCAKLI